MLAYIRCGKNNNDIANENEAEWCRVSLLSLKQKGMKTYRKKRLPKMCRLELHFSYESERAYHLEGEPRSAWSRVEAKLLVVLAVRSLPG